jgi:homoserine dehydrogenase
MDPRLIVIGKGNVGRAFLRQAGDRVAASFDSKSFRGGWNEMTDGIAKDFKDPIIIDLTAADNAAAHRQWIDRGWTVVTANKKPLSGSQEDFKALTADSRRYWHEATVGAGLPVISTLRELLMTGDRVLGIRAALSGTMGFIFSACAAGKPFREAVAEAKSLGYTEPDPRDDLAGTDIARKALILARVIGQDLELKDIPVESLVPAFEGAAGPLEARFDAAAKSGNTLRYLADIGPDGVTVGVRETGRDDPFSSLDGPENLFLIRTERYAERPLVIRGPGAGAEVTAAGVLGDVLGAHSLL